MKTRRKARGSALQALYQCDTLDEWSDELIDRYFSTFTREDRVLESSIDFDNCQFARQLISGVIVNLKFIDQGIATASTHWNISRMSRVDRNILRIAFYEMAFCSDIPTNVSINEAIEVAKKFGADDSPMFINGVLDRLATMLIENVDFVAQVEQLRQVEQERKTAVNG